MDGRENMVPPLCAIPARGGSKRLPRKNLARVGGVSLVVRSVRAAQASGVAERVHVLTDDPEIATEAEGAGAMVPGLVPAELAGDLIPSHAPAQWLARNWPGGGEPPPDLILLQPSSPLCSAQDIAAAWQQFCGGDHDFLVSVTEIDPHYFHWATIREGERWRMWFGDQFLMERPLLPPVFRPNGAIKIARLAALRSRGNFFGPKLTAYAMPEQRSVHVATGFDLKVANVLAESS